MRIKIYITRNKKKELTYLIRGTRRQQKACDESFEIRMFIKLPHPRKCHADILLPKGQTVGPHFITCRICTEFLAIALLFFPDI